MISGIRLKLVITMFCLANTR